MPASSAITSKHTCVPHRSAARGMMIAVLAVLAALLASPPAGALVPAGNLVVNLGAEQGSAATDDFHGFAPPSWSPKQARPS
jgi:hypothetical protein